MTKPLIILGGGGHAAVLVEILRKNKRNILGLVSPDSNLTNKVFDGIPHFLNDNDVLNFDNSIVKLVNGIGALPGNNLRLKLYEHFNTLGYEFETVIDSNSIISNYSTLAEGVQIMAGAIIQTGARVGANSIINTGSIIEHDCSIGFNNHVAPGVTLSGQVQSKENVHWNRIFGNSKYFN